MSQRPVSQRPAGRVPAGSARTRPPGARSGASARPVEPHGATAVPVTSSRTPLTGRAAVFAVVLVVLVLSFAYPLRGWFDQRAQISELNERTIAQERKIADLRVALERWDDPAYVEAVARERLRFVMPGEVSFVVLGDGAVDGAVEPAADEPGGEWWQRLWSSVEEADQPLAPPAGAAGQPATPDPSTGAITSPGPAGAASDAPAGGSASPAPADAG